MKFNFAISTFASHVSNPLSNLPSTTKYSDLDKSLAALALVISILLLGFNELYSFKRLIFLL